VLSFLDLSNRDAGSIPDFGKNEQKNLQERVFDEFTVRFPRSQVVLGSALAEAIPLPILMR
jgi:hypothetical protein